MHDHVHGPPCLPDVPGGHWPSIIAPTLGDAVTSCINGPSGLRKWDPNVKVRQTAGGTVARWDNGVEAKVFGAHTPEDVERLRSGGNRCYVWAEELAAWRYLQDCWQHMRYGLRIGPWPHVVVSTTPKAYKLIKEMVKRSVEEEGKPRPYVVITKASTADNPHLDQRVKDDLYEDYGGTRVGRQELDAEILEDVEGALWTMEDIEPWRHAAAQLPRFGIVTVNIDPQGVAGGDETGITVTAMVPHFGGWPRYPRNWQWNDKAHLFVLADYTINGKPKVWAARAIEAMNDFDANFIVAETNNGHEMVEHTIRTEDDRIRVIPVHASKGKAVRAEPVSALYQQGRGHHVGVFPKLEEQMTEWDAYDPDPSWSPDRMDSLVWGGTQLITGKRIVHQHRTAVDRRLAGRR